LKATQGDARYNIGENRYLAKNASTLSYEVTITGGGNTWSYDEVTMLRMNEFDEPLAHADHNTLRMAGSARPPLWDSGRPSYHAPLDPVAARGVSLLLDGSVQPEKRDEVTKDLAASFTSYPQGAGYVEVLEQGRIDLCGG